MREIIGRELLTFLYYFYIQFLLIAPYWAGGILVGSLISVFAKERIHRLFLALEKKDWGIIGIIPAALLGIASPLCMFGTIPLVASFGRKGFREDWLAAFMMSSMLLNPQLLVYSMALGHPVFTLRILFSFLAGLAAGIGVLIFSRLTKKPFFSFSQFDPRKSRDTDSRILVRLLFNIGRNIKITGPWFLLGIVLTALYQRYVPDDLVANLFGGKFLGLDGRFRGFGVLTAAALGVPVYVCGGGTIPLLAQWLREGMSVGSAVAFMITGPATKLTNLSALKIVFSFRHFLLYLVFVILFALNVGVSVDFVLSLK